MISNITHLVLGFPSCVSVDMSPTSPNATALFQDTRHSGIEFVDDWERFWGGVALSNTSVQGNSFPVLEATLGLGLRDTPSNHLIFGAEGSVLLDVLQKTSLGR